jgi:glucose-6-phosphate 1-dehydrogenase
MEREKTNHTDQATVEAATRVPDLNLSDRDCLLPEDLAACAIVILGATGDLTARKLIPALFNLYLNGGLPESFLIVGAARSQWDDESFRQRMKKALREAELLDEDAWRNFAARLFYRRLDYGEAADYRKLAGSLKALQEKTTAGDNRLFYIALPPGIYIDVVRRLGKAGLNRENENGGGWSRIVVEKPFGTDLQSAAELDREIQTHFGEHQVFRIDHYLAKETVQDILIFRFANSLFEPIWNRRYIDYVSIRAAEILGVEHRAGYYEKSGVLRDMFQNHMMQLLSLMAMEPPSRFEADLVRDEKVKVFRALRPFPVENIQDFLVLGQYTAGELNGRRVAGYREEAGVDPNSLTPTYAMMKIFLDNWRWQGVPFYLSSGKRLSEKITEIAVQFKEVPHSMFRRTLGESIAANRLVLGIHPEEKITLTFQTKNPGAGFCLRTVTMDFHYQQNYSGPMLDAYEKVLIDCMLGDQMLFWRQDGIERSWAFLTPVLEACETCGDRRERLHFYAAGSSGPAAARRLFKD